MFNRIQTRELLAWAALAIAFILLGATIAMGQIKTVNVERENGKVHMKISKTENGQTVKIDTTFEATDDMDLNQVIESFNTGDEENVYINSQSFSNSDGDKGKNKDKKKKQVIIHLDNNEMTEAQKEKLHEDLKKSMKDMRLSLEEMKQSLRNMHIHIDSDSDSDYDFNFEMPEIPEIDFDVKSGSGSNSYSYSYSHSRNAELDSLADENHIVIIAGKDEKAPELERVITSKSGKKIYIYKRSGSENGSGKNESKSAVKEKPAIHDLEYYPNPTSGKFTLKFESDKSDDLLIEVLDSNSKEVFSEKLNDFKGEYSREIDLSAKSKGNYILKISQGEKSISKKIVLN